MASGGQIYGLNRTGPERDGKKALPWTLIGWLGLFEKPMPE
jgi:hypothetical protein